MFNNNLRVLAVLLKRKFSIKQNVIKRNKLIAFLLLVLLMPITWSCHDFLEQKPQDGLVRADYWNNKEEVLATLAGAYKQFAVLDYNLLLYGELRGDMLDRGFGLQSDIDNIMTGNIYSGNDYAKWEDFYSVINLCNHIISIAPSVQEKDLTFSDFLLQQYISEATFLRSLTYFYLVRIWNNVPLVLEPTETDNADFYLPLSDASEVLNKIKDDLINIRLTTPNVYPTMEQSKSRATSGAVNALLADICLWNFEYEEALQYATNVEESGNYFIVPAIEWFDIFRYGSSLETIFEIYFDQQIDERNGLYNNTFIQNYFFASEYASTILGIEVLGASEQVRGNGSISISQKIWKYAGNSPDKRTPRPTSEQYSANFIIYRLSDVLLMKAEALSQLERYDEALYYINLIRERANVNPLNITGNKNDFENAILEERAKELAFEGKRWFDLLRMGRRDNYANKQKLINILVRNVPSTQRLVQEAKLSNPLGWFMPIHRDEIERNNNISQNTYYYEAE